VALTSSSSSGKFYGNINCSAGQVETSLSIGTGASGANFWYKDTAAGSPVITATSTGGVTSSPTQTETEQ
jgi:hypothetical protein